MNLGPICGVLRCLIGHRISTRLACTITDLEEPNHD